MAWSDWRICNAMEESRWINDTKLFLLKSNVRICHYFLLLFVFTFHVSAIISV